MWKFDTTMWWRQTGSSRVNRETRGPFHVRNARQHGKQKPLGEVRWNACMCRYCTVYVQRYVLCLCVCMRERERARARQRQRQRKKRPVFPRDWMELDVCVHETHFTQRSTCIPHSADEVSGKVAVLWQIKSGSCKASINLAFPLEWNVFVLGGNCPEQ